MDYFLETNNRKVTDKETRENYGNKKLTCLQKLQTVKEVTKSYANETKKSNNHQIQWSKNLKNKSTSVMRNAIENNHPRSRSVTL